MANQNVKQKNSPMMHIASFIVDKRMLFFLLYAIMIIFSFFSAGWVKVDNSLSDYLSETTETRQGVDLMNKQFTTFGSAKIMVANISFQDADSLKSKIEKMDGVQGVVFTTEDADQEDFVKHYNDGSALFTVTFNYPEDDDRALEALEKVEDKLSDYDLHVHTDMGNQQAEVINTEINRIMVLVAGVVLAVLLFTSQSTGEIPVLVITFLASMIVNAGTNFLFGTISFVSNSVSSILQLALSIDYAIIFVNRFKEEKRNGYDTHDAAVVSLSKSIPEILSSSLTTISGLFAMVFMQYEIGADLGRVLIKAILLSLVTVFTLMPGLLILFSKRMEKTQHKNLVPKITGVGKFAYHARFVVPAIFAFVFIGATILQSKCPYVYGYSKLSTPVMNEYQKADQIIDDTFGSDNLEAVVIPHGDYDTEAKLIEALEKRDDVDYCQGLANTAALGDYTLTDKLTPRRFSELLNLDYEVAEVLYSAYAADQGEYGRIIGGISSYRVTLMDMLMFLHDKVDEGYVSLDSDTKETLDDAYTQIRNGRRQLEGDKYDRILCYLSVPLPEVDEKTFDTVDEIHNLAQSYYEGSNVYVVGNSTSERDLRDSFARDNVVVSVVSILFVLIILLFTFKSAGMPLLQILVIEGSIFLNFSWPTISHEKLFFMSELIVSSIQMGANIDYAIVISSRYQEVRGTEDRKTAIIDAVNNAFPTIITSGSIMIFSGLFIGQMTSDACIASIGTCLARGTTISVFLVMFVLPALLVLGDKLIRATAFEVYRPVRTKSESGRIHINGTIRGSINGTVIGSMNAIVRGDVKAVVVSGNIDNLEEDKNLPDSDGGATSDTADNPPGEDSSDTGQSADENASAQMQDSSGKEDAPEEKKLPEKEDSSGQEKSSDQKQQKGDVS